MKKKALPEQYLAKIKTAAQLLDKEKAFVDTAVFKINGDYYGFQPFEQKYCSGNAFFFILVLLPNWF